MAIHHFCRLRGQFKAAEAKLGYAGRVKHQGAVRGNMRVIYGRDRVRTPVFLEIFLQEAKSESKL